MSKYLRFVKLIVPHIGIFIFAIICMIGTSLMTASPGAMIMFGVDKILTGKPLAVPEALESFTWITAFLDKINSISQIKLLYMTTIFFVVAFLLKGIFQYLQTVLMNDLSQRVIRDVKNMIYEKLLALSMDFYSKNPTGQLMSKITYDANIIRDAISSAFADTFFQPIQLIAYVVIMITTIFFGMPLKLILLSLVLFPMIIYPVVRIGKRLRKISRSSQEKIGDINNMLLETITASKVVKSFNMQNYEWNRFKDKNQVFYLLTMKALRRMKIVSPMTEIMGIACGSVIMLVVGKSIISGELSAGVFGAFLFAVFSMMKPAKKLSNVYGVNQQALAAADRIFELLDEPVTIKDKEDAVEFTSFETSIEFKDIAFTYGEEKELVLEDIELEIKKGEIVALVGPSGGGKSTIVNLIPRFYDPTNGKVLINGAELKNFSIRSLRENIGMVTQETLLFNDTVRENITYGHEIDEEQLERVARAANAHMFIKDFPEGYNTMIGERGLKVSGGQRQRIAIARAIYKNPPILIFDEATSQLDTESEKLVQDAINNLMKGRTVVVIAHRLSTIKHADKIVVIDKGRIVGSGSHEELMNTSPLYQKLYEMQFSF
ncbi:MAG: ABC transporter ATP-binding protein [Candidatus Omnitrophica bacterium]|nr:ABC transporter ATP-binding protein [Candidatus Omnitrophota bacterium]